MRRFPPAFTGSRSQYALDEVRWVIIGGIPQAIHVLAKVPSAPVLLFLHGGPGISHMPFTYVNAQLAESFVVVQWDQRGAGKTFCASPAGVPLTIDHLINDACEMVEWLCCEFRQERAIVVGHSCGSAIGAFVAARCSQRIRAFVGVGQVTNLQTAEWVRFAAACRIASRNRDGVSLRRLREIGPPPYRTSVESDTLECTAASMMGDCIDPFADKRFLDFACGSGVSTEEELRASADAARFSQKALWAELVDQLDLVHQVPRLNVPVGFILGGRDLLAPSILAEEYFQNMRAPHGKVLCRLDGVGHWLHLQAPDLYRAMLRTVLAQSA